MGQLALPVRLLSMEARCEGASLLLPSFLASLPFLEDAPLLERQNHEMSWVADLVALANERVCVGHLGVSLIPHGRLRNTW